MRLADRYRIERELGAGGMATVYLAQDLRHQRPVALKVLKPELAAVLGAARFLAEIKTTANLQHPHILPLHDSGEVDGTVYYVMPFVDGESLRNRLSREKQLPVEVAVRIASEVADALHYAHGLGIVHRDIKPENILLKGGHALVADFGIALAASSTAGSRMTETGMSLGTPAYMSPEQATGDRVVDGRTDIYSLAAMTYEMLVGDPPHMASTAQAIMAKVLTERPASVRISRPNVPEYLDAALARGLEKLAADRYPTAGEFAEALAGRGITLTGHGPGAPPAGRASVRRVRAWQAATAALAILAAGAGWVAAREAGTARDVRDAAPVIRSILNLPAGSRIQDALAGPTIAVSPKGDMIAYAIVGGAGFRTFVHHTSEFLGREILDANNAPVGGRNLTFSPDGRWVAFTEGNSLKKAPVDGGQAVTLVPDLPIAIPYGLSWGANDTILVGAFTGLGRAPAAGGQAVMVGIGDSTAPRIGRRWPMFLPGERAVLYATGTSAADAPQLGVLDLTTLEVTVHPIQMAVPLGLLDGQLIFVSPRGIIMAVPFDLKARRPVGDPVPLDDGVVVDPTAGAKASLSPSGTLVYLRGRTEHQPVVVSASGGIPEPLIQELNIYSAPRYSPDGRRVALTVLGVGTSDVWIYDILRNTFTRLTTDGANLRPEWTPDGKRVVFISVRGGQSAIWWQPANGSGPAELLYQPPMEPFEAIISPDAKWLVFRTAPGGSYPRDILMVPLTGERTVTPVVTGPGTESMPRLSPDGRWLAYQSSGLGRFEVFVRPFPGTGSPLQVSTLGGTEPIWDPTGRALYYRDDLGQITRVTVTTGDNLTIGVRRVVVAGDYLTDASHPNYDVSPAGEFLLVKRAGDPSRAVVIHNWGRELRAKTMAPP